MTTNGISLSINGDDLQEINSLKDFLKNTGVKEPVDDISVISPSVVTPRRFPCFRQSSWNSASGIESGEEGVTGQALLLWKVSEDLAGVPVQGNFTPKVRVKQHRKKENERDTELLKFIWATNLHVRIKRTAQAAGGSGTQWLYELIGVKESEIPLLERLLMAADIWSTKAPLVKLVYKGQGDNELISGTDQVMMFMKKVNLSKITNPSEETARPADSEQNGLQMSTTDFVRLLWEGSITRSGGFYLYYYDPGAGENASKMLPDHIFDDQGKGTIQLLVLFKGDKEHIRPYINCLVTEGPQEDKSVYAEIVSHSETIAMQENQCLEDISRQYCSDVILIAEQNASVPLAVGMPIVISGGVFKAGDYGKNTFKEIASRFGRMEDVLKNVNLGLDDDQLTLFQPVMLPPIERDTQENDSFQSLSKFYGVPVAVLAATNKGVKGLFPPTAQLTVPTGPMNRTSLVAPGIMELRVECKEPEESEDFNPEKHLKHLFHMLHYQIYENRFFRSSQSLVPLGPRDEPRNEDQAQNTRLYTKSLPYTRFVKGAGDSMATNPYLGIGSVLQVHVGWMDIFGNRLPSPKAENPSYHSEVQSVIIGFTDDLIGPAHWPSSALYYQIIENNEDKASLRLKFQFDATAYQVTGSKSAEDITAKTRADLIVYEKILQQFQQRLDGNSAVNFMWHSSLLKGFPENPLTFSDKNKKKLIDWLSKITRLLRDSTQIRGETNAYELTLAEDILKSNITNQPIFKLETYFIMERPSEHVSANFRTTESVWKSITEVKPYRPGFKRKDNSTDADTQEQQGESLRDFAAELEKALKIKRQIAFKTAVGPDRLHTRRDNFLWLVRLGLAEGRGISYQIENAGEPLIYAPIPLSNKSETRTSHEKWQIDQGGDFIVKGAPDEDPYKADSRYMDRHARHFLQMLDRLLSPEFAAPLGVLQMQSKPDYVNELIAIKERLAEVIRKQVMYVYREKETDAVQPAQQAFKQHLLHSLSHAYDTNAIVQFNTKVYSDELDNDIVYPSQLYGSIVPSSGSPSLPPQVTWNHPKLELSSENVTSSLLHISLSSKNHTNLAEEATQTYIEVSAGYLPTHVEHQVGDMPNAVDYKASSWLHFVIPPKTEQATDWPLYQSLKTFRVPLIQKDYPEVPRLIRQACEDPLKEEVRELPLHELLEWNYTLSYSMSKHYPQDRVYFTVQFESPEESRALGENRDLCIELAQFEEHSGRIQEMLATQLLTLTPDSFGSEEAITKADKAINVFKAMATRITEAWEQLPDPSENITRGLTGKMIPDYQFYVEEEEDEVQGELVIRLVEVYKDPSQNYAPQLKIDGYETETSVFIQKKDCYDGVIKDRTTYEYRFQQKGQKLEAKKGLAILPRKIVLHHLNVIEKRVSHVSSYVTRNEELVPERCMAEPFVYQTEQFPMAEPLTPYLFRPQPIRMAAVVGVEKGPLIEYLKSFFKLLFGGQYTRNMQRLQVEIKYEYDLPNGLSTISVPIRLTATESVDLSKDFEVTDGWSLGTFQPNNSFVCNLASVIWNFFSTNTIFDRSGRIVLDVKVMSYEEQRIVPVLQLANIYLELAALQPEPLSRKPI